jgi:hypothetical protein
MDAGGRATHGAVAEENKIKWLHIPLIPYMDSSFIASKFSQLMPTTEIMIAAIYPVS